MNSMLAIRAGRILTPLKDISPATILVEGGKISAVGTPDEISIPAGSTVIDATDKIAVPGFIDTHTHARNGHWYGEDPESTAELCRHVASTGITSLLPTLGSHPCLEEMLKQIRVVREVMVQGTGGAEILGIHMEGPFLSGNDIARGSQLVSALHQPSVDELHQMVEASEGSIREMSIAPELDGALDVIREMVKLNIVPSAAHSAATYQQAMEAVEAGLKCATHTFNGMIPLHHRKPGLLGAVLTCNSIQAELIADGQHVGAVAMQILWRSKGVEQIHLATDTTIG